LPVSSSVNAAYLLFQPSLGRARFLVGEVGAFERKESDEMLKAQLAKPIPETEPGSVTMERPAERL
jgi:hypothetical protein